MTDLLKKALVYGSFLVMLPIGFILCLALVAIIPESFFSFLDDLGLLGLIFYPPMAAALTATFVGPAWFVAESLGRWLEVD